MEFIREKIKDKPISRKRLASKLLTAALSGLVFAAAACVVLLICFPLLKKNLLPQMSETENGTQREDQNTQDEIATEGTQIVIPPNISLSISDYQTLQDELYRIGNEVNRSIVTVSSAVSQTEWMENDFETEGQGSGVIVYEDNNYLYILTEQKVISNPESIRISFVDRTGAEATMLKHDGNTGIAILTVEKRQISAETEEFIEVAKIGSSYAMTNGAIVIALGSPLGTNYSILTGNITSVENEMMTADKNYSVFTTDIIAGKNGSGVLVNTRGEIVGIVLQSFSGSQEVSTLTAVAIDELTDMLKILLDGKDVPYLGLYVSTVTEEISADYDIPRGIFVKEAAADSPAMRAGLQSGDVIVGLNGEALLTDMVYSNKLSQLIPGTTCEVTVKRQNGNDYYELTCEVEIGVLK